MQPLPTKAGYRIIGIPYVGTAFFTQDSDRDTAQTPEEGRNVISLHCPLFPETRGLICTGTIAKMKDGVILFNNSRGLLIVEADVADALNRGKIYYAGVDVVETEPIRGG